LARNTCAVCVDATAPNVIVQTTRTVSRGRVRTTWTKPSRRSRRCPALAASAPWRLAGGILSTSSAERRNDTALTQYAKSGPHAATSTPPMTGATVQLTFSPVWMSEFALVRSSSSTRFGNPA
jgi:hypothetical protein